MKSEKRNCATLKNGLNENKNSIQYQIVNFEKRNPKPIKNYSSDMFGEIEICPHLDDALTGLKYLNRKVKNKDSKAAFEEMIQLIEEAYEIALSVC